MQVATHYSSSERWQVMCHATCTAILYEMPLCVHIIQAFYPKLSQGFSVVRLNVCCALELCRVVVRLPYDYGMACRRRLACQLRVLFLGVDTDIVFEGIHEHYQVAWR